MNPATELAPQLKQLRLSGILDSLDARNRQAIDAKLAYTEFLALLIQDEVARREQKKFATRLRRAAFRATKTLEGFEFDRLPSTNRALVHDLATGRYIHEKAPVLIVGPCGTGKSHLAQALGHCAVRQGQDVVFASCAQLLASLNAARAIGNYERKLQQLARVPLLIIDDFGLKPLRAPADEDLGASSPSPIARSDRLPLTGGPRRNQLVAGAEAPRAQVGRSGCIEHFKLDGRVRPGVHLGRLHIGVAQPQRDLAQILGRLENRQSTAVPQDMGRDAFGG